MIEKCKKLKNNKSRNYTKYRWRLHITTDDRGKETVKWVKELS